MTGPADPPRGFALVFSMLLVLALMALATGVLAVATREAWLAGAVSRKARADRRAESAALEAVESWSTRAVTDLPVGGRRRVADGTGETMAIERVDSGLFLVRTAARVPGPDGVTTATAGLLVRVVLPGRLMETFPAALTADGPVTLAGGRVTSTGGGVGTCDDAAPGVFAADVTLGAAEVGGDPPVYREAPPTPTAPDPLGPGLVAAVATVRSPGQTAVPRPVTVDGQCVPDRRNWGSPDPGHPCHDLRPVVLAGTLVIAGGVGRGVLVVEGDLRIEGDAEMEGLIVVRGHLELAGGTVRGAVRARSASVTGGVIERDGCAAARVASAPALDAAFRPPTRWWVPTF